MTGQQQRQNRRTRGYRAAVKAELEQLRAERGLFWRPLPAPSRLTHRSETARAAALAEITTTWFGESV